MRIAMLWMGGLGAVSLLLAGARGQRPQRPERPYHELLDLVKTLRDGKSIKDQAVKLARRHDWASIMSALLAEKKGGVGIGRYGESIESRLKVLAAEELDSGQQKKQRAELLELAHIGRAVGELAAHYGPDQQTRGLGPRQWKQHGDDLRRAAAALEDAVYQGAGRQARAAALRMKNACINCHSDFERAARPPRPKGGVALIGPVKEVIDLAEVIGKGKATSEQLAQHAKAIRKKHYSLAKLMTAYKPWEKGGIGYGKTGEAIELKVIDLSRRTLSEKALAARKDDLERMVNVHLAMVEITEQYAPTRTIRGVGPSNWKRHRGDLRRGAESLRQAAKDGAVNEVRRAATTIKNACENCHADFRDR